MLNPNKDVYSIREVMEETGLPASTLRYWESQFDEFIKPRKDGHLNRQYRMEDIEVIKRIQFIRDDLKITRIDAIRNELKTNTKQTDSRQRAIETLRHLRNELSEIRSLLSNSYDRELSYTEKG